MGKILTWQAGEKGLPRTTKACRAGAHACVIPAGGGCFTSLSQALIYFLNSGQAKACGCRDFVIRRKEIARAFVRIFLKLHHSD